MTHKRSKPACGDRAGLGIEKLASFKPDNTKPRSEFQAEFPVAYLVARTRVAPSTARVFAELNAWGRA